MAIYHAFSLACLLVVWLLVVCAIWSKLSR